MKWLLVVLLGCAVWVFFNANVFWRRRRRSDIGHAIRSLLVLLEDGGWLSIKVRDSPIHLQLVREKGVDSIATLNLQIPKEVWSLVAEQRIRGLCEAQGYEGTFEALSNRNRLCEIRLSVDDIWGASAGASGARLVNLVLDALGASQSVRLKLDLVGTRSRRLVQREKVLRESDGKE